MKPINLRRAVKRGKLTEFDKWGLEQLMTENKPMNQADKKWVRADGWELGTCLHSDPAHTFCTKCVSEAIAAERRKVLSDPRMKFLIAALEKHDDCGEYQVSRAKALSDFQELLKEAGDEI